MTNVRSRLRRLGAFAARLARRAGPSFVVSAVSLAIAVVSLAVSWSIHANQGLHYAWGRAPGHVPGNSGVAGALEHLHARGEDLRWIDLRPVTAARAADDAAALAGGDVLAIVRETNLAGAILREAWLDETDFSNAVLKDADLTGARMRRARFAEADLSGALLERARFDDSDLSRVVMIDADADGVFLLDATLRAGKFDGSSMADARLDGVDALDASFAGADLAGARLKNGIFRGAVFADARLAETDLSYGDLENSSFAGADLSGARLVGATVWGADFSRANLSGADIARIREAADAKWDGAWAWSDNPPAFPEDAGIEAVLYDPGCRGEWERSGELRPAPPDSCRAPGQ